MKLRKSEKFIELKPHSNQALLVLCGSLNKNLQFIENTLSVTITNKGFNFKISGHDNGVSRAKRILLELYRQILSTDQMVLDEKDIHLEMCDHTSNKPAKKEKNLGSKEPRNDSQKKYLDTIMQQVVTIGTGPAGTGKTYVAVMAALQCLRNQEVDRLIISRPAVDAGEKLGFLPGDLTQKVDPYLRPLYDSLYDLCGPEQTTDWIDKGKIEIAPLAFIRGRTFNRSFIILDEGQNATSAQIRMLLTRIGYSSKCIITGDLTQTDLVNSSESGLSEAIEVLKYIQHVGIYNFSVKDVVRHPIVKQIIEAYDLYHGQ